MFIFCDTSVVNMTRFIPNRQKEKKGPSICIIQVSKRPSLSSKVCVPFSKDSFSQNYMENCNENNLVSLKLNISGLCTVIIRKSEKYRN